MGGKRYPCIQWKDQVHSLHFEFTTSVASQRIEAPGEVVCPWLSEIQGCSVKAKNTKQLPLRSRSQKLIKVEK